MISNKDCQDYNSDNKFAICTPMLAKSQHVLLECGDGTGSITFTSSNDAPFQLAHVTVDTTCLIKPTVLVKFSSLVSIERLDVDESLTVRLKYELSRGCEDGSTISLGTWVYEKVDAVFSEFINVNKESFNFIFCECTNCHRCCEYFVTITPLEIVNARVVASDGRMAALLGSTCDASRNEMKEYDDFSIKHKHKPKKIILKCGQETGSAVFNNLNEPPVRIANVSIDTSKLCYPKVLIEFSSIVTYSVVTPPGDPVLLQFELFRICDNTDPISLGIWRFEVDFVNQTTIVSKAFGFIFCECATYLGCCDYFVMVTPIDVPIGFAENTIINDSRIVALAQSNVDNAKKQDIIHGEQKGLKSIKQFLACGQGNGDFTFNASSDIDFQIAQVTIDTTGLCKNKVNIEFSNLVSFDEQEDFIIARLRYELFSVCDDGQPEPRGVWVWRRETILAGKVTESFDFTFCETIVCKSNCCTYFVKVTPIVINGGQVTVSNGRIAALIQEGK